MKTFMSLIWMMLVVNVVGAIEMIEVVFDDRQWEIGYVSATEQSSITEYVLENESVKNWTELITVQAFYGLQDEMSSEVFMNKMKSILIDKCPGTLWEVLDQSEDNILYEWEVAKCSVAEEQFEVARIIRGSDAIHVLHYAIKRKYSTKEKRDMWRTKIAHMKMSQ